ncbi:hypothetical protein V1227_06515 [Lentzea sp. DG1S-22]|uniref:hypothetical protein n=1 Tax=Lentzea sp. DG1S-22 TaxID=3108822 RepID=UPI002E7788A8|nr:hypothetical protein [Lentzea sp. DG1S-22]WVH82406.1 hypothetical protein V1227_06515 [Lentzea sp. DG1S-22]
MRPSTLRRRAPHLVAASTPTALLVPALVRNLAETIGCDAVYCEPTAQGLAVTAAWPWRAPGQVLAADFAALALAPGVLAAEPVSGGGGVAVGWRGRLPSRLHGVVRETAVWLGVAARTERLRDARDRAAARASRLDAELSTAHMRLGEVRELERRRLVGAITALVDRDFAEVRRRLRELTADVDSVRHLREGLDELLETFRVTVRGVHPAMLSDVGPQETLEELAATLRRNVRFRGDLGRRVGWEVESGFYHAAAAVLNLLAARENPVALDLQFSHADDALVLEVVDPAWPQPVERLREQLSADAERIAVLGGELTWGAVDGGVRVSVRMPERIAADEAESTEPGLRTVVRDLVARGCWATGLQERGVWTAIADRLDQPLRLAVVGPARAEVVGALLGRAVPDASEPVWFAHNDSEPAEILRSLTLLQLPGQVDEEFAAALAEDSGWAVDAVLCLAAPHGLGEWLRNGPHRVELVVPVLRPGLALLAVTATDERHGVLRSVAPLDVGGMTGQDLRTAVAAARRTTTAVEFAEELDVASGLRELRETVTRRLVARADLIAARRALVAAETAVRRLPTDDPMRWDVDRTRAGAHALVELDLLDDIERDLSLPPDLAGRAVRLLGGGGSTVHERLGLPTGASRERVRSAALAEAEWWRMIGGRFGASGRMREVCEAVVRSCEGLAG